MNFFFIFFCSLVDKSEMFSSWDSDRLLVLVLLKCDDSRVKFYKESSGPREGY